MLAQKGFLEKDERRGLIIIRNRLQIIIAEKGLGIKKCIFFVESNRICIFASNYALSYKEREHEK